MSDIELVIRSSKKLEGLLERHFAATGRGLHEKVSSVERRLPEPLVRKLRFIATVRNRVVHDEGADHIDDRAGFKEACAFSEAQLRKLAGVRTGGRWRWWLLLLGVVLGAAIAIYFKYFR
jgi:hypothetical protein